MSTEAVVQAKENGGGPESVLDLLRPIAQVILVAAVVCANGCARADWIDRTLVTVDVTGTWEGTTSTGALWQLVLEQEGTRVQGSWRRLGGQSGSVVTTSGLIEGTVAGDVVSFQSGAVTGEMRVSGEAMSGSVFSSSGNSPVTLRRVDSPPRGRTP